MGIPLVIYRRDAEGMFTLADGTKTPWPLDLPVGAMWPCDCHGEKGWLIRLPDGPWGPDMWCTLETAGRTGNRWNVSGEAPNLTVTPSIDASPGWHGNITNGELTGGGV